MPVAVVVIGVVFGLYLWSLYGQLATAFTQQREFVPTRIFSDITRVVAPQPRAHILERLSSLGYVTKSLDDGEALSFNLHALDYPTYLVPDTHPSLEAGDKPVTLRFDGDKKDSLLRSIELDGQEAPDLYLEPELVATLGRQVGGKGEIRSLVKFEEIPARVWQAVIAIEDQHFLEHKGFDPRGLARAVLVNLKSLSLRQGGSTITQQLVKNLMERRSKNLFKKANEFFLALLLEVRFSKEQIIERYLNEVDLGQIGNLEIHGVEEGAEHFFGKKLTDLNLGEIALMAGMVRSAQYYSPYKHLERAVERQKLVLKKMVETGMIDEEEAKDAGLQPIRLAPPQKVLNKAPYFTDFVKAELLRQLSGEPAGTPGAAPSPTGPPAGAPSGPPTGKMTEAEVTEAGFRVYTTLDLGMNGAAQSAIADGIAKLEAAGVARGERATERLEGALASVDHGTGYIRALVGGRSYSASTFNRILNMKRQVGSTFKPFVYLAAIDKGEDADGVPYGPGHPALDAPWTLTFDRGKQSWSPRNYEKGNLGWINYRTALAHSVNTVAARLGYEVGPPNVILAARALGIESDLPAVPSLVLGVAELSPIELLRAYATIANHGARDDLTVIRAITHADGTAFARFVYHPKQVIDPGPADLLADMLRSVFTEGTARGTSFDRPAAGKTGTTNDYRDAWFAGFTPTHTTVVWVGADQQHPVAEESPAPGDKAGGKKTPKPKKKVRLTGAQSALPIWSAFMSRALLGEPVANFAISPDLVDVTIDRKTGKSAALLCPSSQTITEKYVRGKEPRDSSCANDYPPLEAKTSAP